MLQYRKGGEVVKKSQLKLTKKFPLELPLDFHAKLARLAEIEGAPLYLWILHQLEKVVEEKSHLLENEEQ